MNNPQAIFEIATAEDFSAAAIEVFRFQASACAPYSKYLEYLGVDPLSVTTVEEIPFLPIEFFKSHRIYCGDTPEVIVFTSSGTTGSVTSCHYVASTALYEESFNSCFERFYGSVEDITIFALLPNYLERQGSSLVYMVDSLIKSSGRGGFFLHNHTELLSQIDGAAGRGEKILLLGVSFALLDLAESHNFSYPNLTVMETGGMKGRREEITRDELHRVLCNSFGVKAIHSEYGMTELLSQGYSRGDGLFETPPWMKIVTRDLYDPTEILAPGQSGGGLNVIDLANIYSCSFIATQDMGISYADGTFRVSGRIDNSDIRGCNLMVAR